MLDQGRVISINNRTARVEFSSSAACAECGACRRSAAGKMENEADNLVGAKPGDMVQVEISSLVVTLVPMIAFGVPLFFFFIGLALGSFFSERAGIILGVLFLAVSFLIVRMADRYVERKNKFRSRIVRIL